MEISLERTGGFAGISRTQTVDIATTSPEIGQQLVTLLTEIDFFNLPIYIQSPSPRPDRFYYSLTVEENGKKHTVSFAETAVSPQLKAILDLLNQIPTS